MTKRERREFDRLIDAFDLQVGALDKLLDDILATSSGANREQGIDYDWEEDGEENRVQH